MYLLYTGECLYVYMRKCAVVTQHKPVFICVLGAELGKFGAGGSCSDGCEGGRFVVCRGLGGVSDMSLRRRMKRKSVQRGREAARACAFQGVLFVQGCPNIYRALAAVECRGRAEAESSSRGKPLLSSTSADSFPLGQSVNTDSARDMWA